jgi:flavin-binding protein dodecin
MQDKTYVITEIVGLSDHSISQAVANAVARANKTLKALDWFDGQRSARNNYRW